MSNENPYTEIMGIVGGISIATVAVLSIFAKEHLWVAAPVVGALAVLGVLLGYFQKE